LEPRSIIEHDAEIVLRAGEVWWAEHPEWGRRPALVMTREAAIDRVARDQGQEAADETLGDLRAAGDPEIIDLADLPCKVEDLRSL
jgi:hypothetical protein